MRLVLPAIAAFLVLATTTAGPARADNIILEAYTGERSPDAPRLLRNILTELGGTKYKYRLADANAIEGIASQPSTGPMPDDFVAQVDRGERAWISGHFDEALHILNPLVDAAHASPVTVADDPALQKAMQKALVAIALSDVRNGDPKSGGATLAELARSFPDAEVSRALYGQEAADLFAQVRQQLNASGTGTLTVKLSDDHADLFIDERYVGAAAPPLAPGDYRVFAKIGKAVSRMHRVTVRAHETTSLAIDIAFDAAIRTTPSVGLEFATAADRDANESAYASRLAHAVQAGSVIVLGIDQVRGRASVVGSLVSLGTGREIRRASVAIEPDPSSERLRALARYVAGDDPSSDIEVLAVRGGATTPTDHGDHPDHHADGPTDGLAATGPKSGWRWVTGGAALAGLAAGGVLLAYDGSCAAQPLAGHPCTDLRNTALPGFIAGGVGAGLAVVSIYLFVHHGSESSARGGAAYLVPTGDGAMAGYAGRF